MRRLIGSFLVMMIVGIGIGLFLGWSQFAPQSGDSAMCQLSEDYREEYTLMVARGFRTEQDTAAAIRRLLPLTVDNSPACLNDTTSTRIDNIPAWVQEVAERYLTRGGDLQDICDLAALSADFGRQIPNFADRPGTICDQPR